MTPIGAYIASPKSAEVKHEKRSANRLPLGKPWGTFPERFENYLSDHIGLRRHVIPLHHRLVFDVFGDSPVDFVWRGQGGWLFLARDHAVESFQNHSKFSPSELAEWQALLAAISKHIGQWGGKLVFVPVPNKSSIYPEYLPPGRRRAPGETRLQQVIAAVEAVGIPVVGLTELLQRRKAQGHVYSRLDTHWNGWGAYVAYEAIFNEISALRPDLQLAQTSSAYKHVQTAGGLSRMASLHHLREVTVEARTHPVSSVTRLKPQPKASLTPQNRGHQVYVSSHGKGRVVWYRDSFATALTLFLAENFSRSVLHWKSVVLSEELEKERPDIVIFQIVERYLMKGPPPNNFKGTLTPPKPERAAKKNDGPAKVGHAGVIVGDKPRRNKL